MSESRSERQRRPSSSVVASARPTRTPAPRARYSSLDELCESGRHEERGERLLAVQQWPRTSSSEPRTGSRKVAQFVNDKRDQSGDAIPLDGNEPIQVELRALELSDAYALNVYLQEIPDRMRVRWREPDEPLPTGDEDYVTQWVAGKLPGEERIWMLTVDDAVRYITRGRLSLTVGDGASPDGETEVHVATSSRGRRYLRTDPDARPGNNLANLPPLPD